MGSKTGSGGSSAPSYSQAEVQALRDKCNQLADDVRALSTLIHALRTALIGVGLVKGGTEGGAVMWRGDRTTNRSAFELSGLPAEEYSYA